MRIYCVAEILALAVSCLPCLVAQEQVDRVDGTFPPDKRASQVYDNTAKIKMEVTLDRDVYLFGEAIHVTLVASNPTSEALEVFDPFDSGVTDFLHWGEGRMSPFQHWEEIRPHPASEQQIRWRASTIWIAPGQRLEREFVSRGVYPSSYLLEKSDKFMMYFGYLGHLGTPGATFRIRQPRVLRMASVGLRTPRHIVDKATGRATDSPQYVHAGLVEADGKRYVVVSHDTSGGVEILESPNSKLEYGVGRGLVPFDRVAEVSTDADDISIEADKDDNVIVHWQDRGLSAAVLLNNDCTTIRRIQ